MRDILQQKLGVKIEYVVGQNEMRIDMEGAEGNFFARLDEIKLNPKIVDLYNLEIKNNGVKMDFKAPIICKLDNVDFSRSMMAGVKFEGQDKNLLIERIEDVAKSFGPEWETAVQKRKEEIQKRNIMNR
jgi:hypothetical protein